MERLIVISHIYPPIPIRDGADCSPYGYGRTEAEAKQDLLDNYGDDE